jgi:protein-tyrosine phosphatase
MSNKKQAPVLVNCTYGKDRTGIISAICLSLLGKSPDYIADDYAKSAVSSIRLFYHNT